MRDQKKDAAIKSYRYAVLRIRFDGSTILQVNKKTQKGLVLQIKEMSPQPRNKGCFNPPPSLSSFRSPSYIRLSLSLALPPPLLSLPDSPIHVQPNTSVFLGNSLPSVFLSPPPSFSFPALPIPIP